MVSLNKFLKDGKVSDIEAMNGTYMKCLDYVVSEILDPKVPFVEGEKVF